MKGKCIRCAQLTGHKTAICWPCRTKNCAKCGRPWTPPDPSTKKCGLCTGKNNWSIADYRTALDYGR